MLKEFKFEKKLKLTEVKDLFVDEEEINQKQYKFRTHMNCITKEDRLIEKEKLRYLIDNEKERIISSFNKVNTYTIIILALLPLMLGSVDIRSMLVRHHLLMVPIGLMSYGLINICVYLFNAIKVQKIYKSTFKDLRAASEKDKEIIIQYRYDWIHLKNQANLYVSYVANLQQWIVFVMILGMIVYVAINFFNI